jgi:hypothetical protein
MMGWHPSYRCHVRFIISEAAARAAADMQDGHDEVGVVDRVDDAIAMPLSPVE